MYGSGEVLNHDAGVVEMIAGMAVFLLLLVVAGLLLAWMSVKWDARKRR